MNPRKKEKENFSEKKCVLMWYNQAAANGIHGRVWPRDDALVCKGTTVKEYSDRPRTEIRVKKL
jgi:hypothetical protein